MKFKSDFSIIIRGGEEYTTPILLKELSQFMDCTPVVISMVPFEETLRQSCLAGIAENKEYTVMIDGDILPNLYNIDALVRRCKDKGNFFIEGIIFDGLLFNFRRGGIKVYKTELLSFCLNLIPNDGESMRPETEMQKRMTKHGYNSSSCNLFMGYHDFLQYERDYFRKGIVHSKKWNNRIEYMMPIWTILAKKNLGYRSFLKGVKLGLSDSEWSGLNSLELSKHGIESNFQKEVDPKVFNLTRKIVNHRSYIFVPNRVLQSLTMVVLLDIRKVLKLFSQKLK